MFERYTERARRVIFWARYEASQYGSPYIETEHLLLGLLREDVSLRNQLPGGFEAKTTIRNEIEKQIVRRERISTSVEIPLTEDCKKVLNKAAEEAERLAQCDVNTEHLLLGLLHVEGSLAAQILQARGLRLATLREEIAQTGSREGFRPPLKPSETAMATLDSFLAGLKWLKADDVLAFFAENAQFVDVLGKRWNREEMHKGLETLFAPYAKKNAEYLIEETLADSRDILVAMVLWKNAILASMERVWMHRMSLVLVRKGEDWLIVLVQVTPVKSS
ncbi:MAG TPA: Clp protease N-terminal domain-containing protein [Candidatus Acidoferrum sp.]|nr:Clp protease N-terminal domain-containing protein [Candidatus Acidoferrum sp.]